MLTRRLPQLAAKHWACTYAEIDWEGEDLPGKLQYLATEFGFFYDGHNALADCEALLHVLTKQLPISDKRAFAQLLEAARRVTYRLWPVGAPIERKDLLKDRGYRWSPGSSGRPRSWYKDVAADKFDAEAAWLRINVCGDGAIRSTELTALTRYTNHAFTHGTLLALE
jgi:DNA polymerase-3 subunit epsilon